MKKILLIGAGRSATSLINYLKLHASSYDWWLTIGDYSVSLAEEKLKDFSRGNAISFDVHNLEQVQKEVQQVDLVISMLPAHLHFLVAQQCVNFSKSLLTASYVSSEIKMLDKEAKEKGILILMEMGLDPGIDHMSAKKEIDAIHEKGGVIHTFKSFTGGLVAPESDTNPWNYKFTWNPRYVVLAGQGTVKFLRNNNYKYIPYHNLFNRLDEIFVDGYGAFEGYPNRDSLKYRDLYDLQEIPTILRGTLRRKGFCRAWNVFVQLGITDDSYALESMENVTYREFINAYLPYNETLSVEEKIAKQFQVSLDDDIIFKLKWLGLFSNEKIGLTGQVSPAKILQNVLEQKWKLGENDRDMIVMQHGFEYEINHEKYDLKASMVVLGDDSKMTSMAKTVGLPLGIAAKLYLTNQLSLVGVQIPIHKEIYEPILEELKDFGIDFTYQNKKI